MGLYTDAAFVRRAKRALSAADERMARIIKKVGPFKPGLVENAFQALIHSIVHQQISMAAARTISGRVLDLCPRRRLTAKALIAATDQQLREAGLSRQKVTYVRSVCDHFQSGQIKPRVLARLSDEEAIELLIDIRGVGVWTAEMILMFTLQRPDVWPVDDLGLRHALKKSYRIPMTAKRDRLIRAGERFRPYRSVACWYLWSSLDTGIVPGFE
jgi:DNA-3-methyladenine glycosylase II